MKGGDVDSVSSSGARSAPGTSRNKVKFLCSHGGEIIPRPADGHLKYVGGETRVICVLRDITFSELMKKITSMFDGEMILKYQLMPEDLDVLVTVKSDEDVRHMIEECDRHEHLGAPRLRAFLFLKCPILIANSFEQRYINSINGIVVHQSPIYNTFKQLPINTSYTTISISSACSSPRSPPETTTTTNSNHEFTTFHRNHSSPNLCNLGQNSSKTASPNLNQIHHHQPPPQPQHSHKPPLDRSPHKNSGPENLGRMRSTGVGDYYRHQTDCTPSAPNTRTYRGGHMYHQRGSPHDDYYGNRRYD